MRRSRRRLDRRTPLRHRGQVGTLSWIFTLLALNGAVMAVLLLASRGNFAANRFLAALVALISLRLVIYVLGFAGAYDRHPWITFAPLDASLAFGPLLWFYVVALTRTAPPAWWPLHLLPAAIQVGYSLVAFSLPLDTKLRWYGGPHLAIVEPAGLTALLVSCIVYLTLAWVRQRDYQRWLDTRFADRERWRLGWISAVLVAFATMIAVCLAAVVIHVAVVPLGYFGRIPVVVASSLIAYALGLLGWRHATLDLPPQPDIEEATEPPEPKSSRPAAAFPEWLSRIEAEGWWREDGLTLAVVAKRLGVSERTLSRGFSDGAGRSFNVVINDLRVDAVARDISAGERGDLLGLALDCGFNSKASFNRAFRRRTGMTPSAWRATTSQIPPIDAVGAT